MVQTVPRGLLTVLATLGIISITQTVPAQSAGARRVAVFPFQFHAKENLDYLQDGIFVTIAGRLAGERGVEVIDRGLIREAMMNRQAAGLDEETARKMAADLQADYAIVGDLTKEGEVVNLNTRLLAVSATVPPLGTSGQYRGLDAAMEALGDFADRARRWIVIAKAPEGEKKPSDKSTVGSLYEKVVQGIHREKPPPPQPTGGFEPLHTLPTFLRGLDVGDVDGDGRNEIVLMDNRTLWIYKQSGTRLQLRSRIEGHRNDDFLTLDVADVNRNGFAEIMVSNLRAGVLRSFILEFEETRIKKISDRERWFFRVLDHPGKGSILVGQRLGANRRPLGRVYPFTWKEKAFHPGKEPLVNADIPVFGLAVGDLEERGEESVLYLDHHNRLRVLTPDGAFRWESSTPYGGSDISYAVGSQGGRTDEKRFYIPPRLVVKDLDGDGVWEVIVSRNTFKVNIAKRLRLYDRARLVGLAWRGFGFSETWGTPEISGYISDYQVKDVDNDGKDEIIVAAVSKTTLRSVASSSVLVYEIF